MQKKVQRRAKYAGVHVRMAAAPKTKWVRGFGIGREQKEWCYQEPGAVRGNQWAEQWVGNLQKELLHHLFVSVKEGT